MPETVFPLPVSIEQIAALLRRMSSVDRQRLLQLVPELRQDAVQLPMRTEAQIRTEAQARQTVRQLQQELHQALEPLSPGEPFLDGLTLEDYFRLPEEERAQRWEVWASLDTETLPEKDIRPDALPAR